jgi:2-alkyl-3-oxoalkanoate reductase
LTRQVVLVLGASGFIGRRIVAALAATEWARPVAASRNPSRARFGAGVDSISLEATDQMGLERELQSVGAVVSCISGTSDVIVRGGRALLAAIEGVSPRPRLVYLSSMAAYGSARGIVGEAAPLLGDLGEYSLAKATVDRLSANAAGAVRLRPGIVYGPGSPWWSLGIGRLLLQHRLGDLGVRGDGGCNLVHVDDVALAVVRSLEVREAAGEAFNLGYPDPLTWNEYFLRYARALGAAPVRRITGARLRVELGLYGPALKIAAKLLGRADERLPYPPIRPWLTNLCQHDIRIDVGKAEQRLGLQWRPLDTGLEQTAAWLRSGGRDSS